MLQRITILPPPAETPCSSGNSALVSYSVRRLFSNLVQLIAIHTTYKNMELLCLLLPCYACYQVIIYFIAGLMFKTGTPAKYVIIIITARTMNISILKPWPVVCMAWVCLKLDSTVWARVKGETKYYMLSIG